MGIGVTSVPFFVTLGQTPFGSESEETPVKKTKAMKKSAE
jgi:hypothetical protein